MRKVNLLIAGLGLGLLACSSGEPEDPAKEGSQKGPLEVPLVVTGQFQATLWGDPGQIQLDEHHRDMIRPGDEDGECIRISYTPGENSWGAVYWQPKREAGMRIPVTVKEAHKITFWAKGEKGDEKVQFRLAGLPATELLQSGESEHLDPEWKKYELDLGERKVEQVTGLFGVKWTSVAGDNREGLTFYLDDIRVE